MIPELSASRTAGFIGKHAYQAVHEVMYELLLKDPVLKAKIAEIETHYKRVPYGKLKGSLLKSDDVRSMVARAVEESKTADTMTDILATTDAAALVYVNTSYSRYSPEVRASLVEEVRGAVAKQRGSNEENTILNQYEVAQSVVVSERNTKTFRKDYGSFKMVGRTDGYVASHNRIVDSKNRTHLRPDVPLYDEIQLRVYMNMSGCAESELIEQFPNGTARTTRYVNDPAKWEEIENSIREGVVKLNEIVEDAFKLRELVFANTAGST